MSPSFEDPLSCRSGVLRAGTKELAEMVLEAGKLAILKWQAANGSTPGLPAIIGVGERECHPVLPQSERLKRPRGRANVVVHSYHQIGAETDRMELPNAGTQQKDRVLLIL